LTPLNKGISIVDCPKKTLARARVSRRISMSPFIYLLEERIKFYWGRNGDM
jgi:hypothetical protein